MLIAVFPHQAYASHLLPPSRLQDGGSTQHILVEGPEALPCPISALRDHRVKNRQDVNFSERIVLPQWGKEGYLLTPSVFSPLRSTTSSCPSHIDPLTTEGRQDGLLSQQLSEKTEGSCMSVGSATSQLCDFGLLNTALLSAFGTVVCIRTRGVTESLELKISKLDKVGQKPHA